MNILFFNRSFYPDVEATGQFLTELCEDLVDLGHNVTVITGRPYFVNGSKHRYLIRHEKYKSIDVIRASSATFSKRFLFLRLVNLGTYFLLAFVAGFFVKQKPKIIIVQTDPPLLGLLGIFFSKWYKAKFIYYCKDVYPDVGVITGRLTNPIFNFILEKINLLSFKCSERNICIGEDMKRNIIGKGIDGNKIEVIHDWADTSVLFPVNNGEEHFKSKYKSKDQFTIMYSGNLGLTQSLEKLINVAIYFKNRDNIRFLLIGEGANKANLINLAKKNNLTNIDFLPFQPKEELKYSLSSPDIHLITFQKGLAGVMVPSKVYGILACGKPFIAWIDKESEISTIARKFKCGITVPPENVRGMIRAIEWAVKHPRELSLMGSNGRKTAEKYFDRKISVSKFNNTLMEVSSISNKV